MSRPQLRKAPTERYELNQSPLAQKPTQKELAHLLGVAKAELRAMARAKEIFIVRRQHTTGKKLRNLAYPRGKLRRVHELLRFHLSKVKQPEYLFSPRRGRAQRDHALLHSGQRQLLLLDIKQFYPSTSREHVFRWAKHTLGMYDDVAGLLTEIITVDDAVSFGSPATPVLTTLVHRQMFDEIYRECKRRGLRMSIWVDDIVISGQFVPGPLLTTVREIIRKNGLKSHKLEYKTTSRCVVITGVPVKMGQAQIPKPVAQQIRGGYAQLQEAEQSWKLHKKINDLLSLLGSARYTAGRASPIGRKTADRMEALRQRRAKIPLEYVTERQTGETNGQAAAEDSNSAPF